MRISTSPLREDYIPWDWLKYYDVTFRGKAPPMFVVADSDRGYLELADGRMLLGEVTIEDHAPF